MRQTGLTRKIDELGRIVIPKEIRKNLVIKDGENLEIFTNDNEIILKKYSEMDNYEKRSIKYIKIFKEIYNLDIYLTDREKYLYPVNKKLDNYLLDLIDNRESYNGDNTNNIKLIELKKYNSIIPIINDSLCIGLIIISTNENIEIIKLAKLLVKLILDNMNYVEN